MISDHIQCGQHILPILNGCVDNGSKDSEVLSRTQGFKLTGDFLLDFDITDRSFRVIIMRWYFRMIKERKHIIPVFYESLLKAYQFFLRGVNQLCQQFVQLIFEKTPGMVRIIVIRWREPLFYFLGFKKHKPEPRRPGNRVKFFQIFEFPDKMNRTQLM